MPVAGMIVNNSNTRHGNPAKSPKTSNIRLTTTALHRIMEKNNRDILR